MIVTRYQLVIIIFIAVIAVGVGLAVYYVDRVFNEREEKIDKIKRGDVEDLIEKAPKKPPGPPPLDRPATRGTSVLRVQGLSAAAAPFDDVPRHPQVYLSILGNGEFMRRPSRPDEKGPIVTGILDRAVVDELIRSVIASPPAPGDSKPAYVVSATATPSGPPQTRPLSEAAVRPLLEVVGKEMNRSAVPERVTLTMEPAEGAATAPWPFKRVTPESFLKPADLLPESDRVAFRQGLLKLFEKDARFSHKDKTWKVAGLDLLK